MKTIWKYIFDYPFLPSRKTFDMPSGSFPLTVAIQNSRICLWMLVVDTNPIIKRTFCIAGTGEKLPDDIHVSNYIGIILQGEYVWHIFEIK